jgi:uncharacterized membrane protein
MGIRKFWNRFFVSFINGVVLILPVLITIWLILFLVRQLNKLILDPLLNILSPISGNVQHESLAKGVIFILVIFVVALIGWGARLIFINRIFSFGERILIKVPFMGRIYNAAKQIFTAFLGQGKTIFKQVVLVEYPRKGLYSIGFTTGMAKGEAKEGLGKSAVNVFMPTTPNPTSGMFIIVPKESIMFLKMTVEEGMKMVISGGSVSPDYMEKWYTGQDPDRQGK